MNNVAFYPSFFNFSSDVVDYFASTADRLALVWASSNGEQARYRYSDISSLSTKLASSMARLGVAKGDRIIILLPRIPEWQIAMVACLRLGAIPIPSIEMLTASDVAYRVERGEVKGAIARVDHISKFDAVIDQIPIRISIGTASGWESIADLIEAGDAHFPAERVAAEDPVLLYFTSGSSGHPKGVLVAARGLYLWRHSAVEWLDLKPSDIIWCTADTGWSKAGTSILFGPWSCGSCSFVYDGPFDPALRLELIEKYEVTVYCASSTELLRVLDQNMGADLSRLRRTVSAGEVVNPSLISRWREAAGHDVAEAYGQTETLMSIGYKPGTAYRSGSTGRELAHNRVDVIDDDGLVLPAGQEGHIALRLPNPQIMLGYWRDPDLTARCYLKTDRGSWFVTGDRGAKDSDGYIFHRGRSDDVINSAGYRIGPSEVEDALLSHPAVREAAVVGAPDAQRGEIVAAFIVLRPGWVPSDELAAAIQNSVKAQTAPYKYPRLVRFVGELPKTLTGKTLRRVLREWL